MAKFALVNGLKTKANQVSKGTIGNDVWFPEYEMKACVGKYRQFWIPVGDKPPLPRGYENETEWHQSWKSNLLDANVEVICGDENQHRADILTNDYVIEIQLSMMDGFDVEERNEFYSNLLDNRLIWVVNIEKPWRKSITTELIPKSRNFYIKWKRGWSWLKDIARTTQTHLYLDFNQKSEKMIHAWYHDRKLIGRWVDKHAFVEKYLSHIIDTSSCSSSEEFVKELTR